MNIYPVNLPMILALVTSLVVAWVMIPPVVKISRSKGLVALPNGRTSHSGAIPTLGGVAIFASLVIGSGLFMKGEYPGEFQYLVPALVILFFTGLQDDLVGIRPWKKLGGQILSSLIVILAADLRMTTLHGILGIYDISRIAGVLITLVIFIGLINAFNLIDGIDGLAGGLGIVISIIFGIWLYLLGKEHYAIFAFAMAGSLIAFYWFNVFSKTHKLFMGDTGSMLIGFMFSVMLVKVICCEVPPESYLYMNAFPVVAISLMIIPVSDTLRVMAMRMVRGRLPFFADRTHCHHDLLRLGFTHRYASMIMITANLALFILAVWLSDMPPFALGLLMLTGGILACGMPGIWLRKVLKRPDESAVHLPANE